MLRLDIDLFNPFSSKGKEFKSLWNWSKRVGFTKVLEMQYITYGTHSFFNLKLDINFVGRDHAGPELEISMGNYQFRVNLYDTRHWDYKNNEWFAAGYKREDLE